MERSPLGTGHYLRGGGGGGYKTGGGRACEVVPLRKGRGGGCFSHTEGGLHKKFWGSFYMIA